MRIYHFYATTILAYKEYLKEENDKGIINGHYKLLYGENNHITNILTVGALIGTSFKYNEAGKIVEINDPSHPSEIEIYRYNDQDLLTQYIYMDKLEEKIYESIRYYYNMKGQLIKEESYDADSELDGSKDYIYEDNELKKVLNYNYEGLLLGYDIIHYYRSD